MDPGGMERQSLAELMLTDAYEFVLSGWCQEAPAVDECGRPVEPASAFARRWSVLGALERAWRRSQEPPDLALDAFELAGLALASAVPEPPGSWNDRPERRQSEVLDALAEAVQRVPTGIGGPGLPSASPFEAVDSPPAASSGV
jgi:hypothetical protein